MEWKAANVFRRSRVGLDEEKPILLANSRKRQQYRQLTRNAYYSQETRSLVKGEGALKNKSTVLYFGTLQMK